MRSQFRKYFRIQQTVFKRFGKHKTDDEPPTLDEIESSDILARDPMEDPKIFNARVKVDRNAYSYQTEKSFNAHIIHKKMDAYNREDRRPSSEDFYIKYVAPEMETANKEDQTLAADYFEERGLNDDYEAEDEQLGKINKPTSSDATAKADTSPVIESPKVDTSRASQKYAKPAPKEDSKGSKSRVSDTIYIDDDMYERNIKCPEEPIIMVRNEAAKDTRPRDAQND